jgi:hypothetical protein
VSVCGFIPAVFIKKGRGNRAICRRRKDSLVRLFIWTKSQLIPYLGGEGEGGRGYHSLLDNPITVWSSLSLIVAASLSSLRASYKNKWGRGGGVVTWTPLNGIFPEVRIVTRVACKKIHHHKWKCSWSEAWWYVPRGKFQQFQYS